MKNIAFVTDFDGTITDDDFFQYVKDAFLDDSALEPWERYLEDKLFHFDALKEMYGALKVKEDKLVALIKNVKVDEWVIPTLDLLYRAGIPIYIASAGCDYYINLLLGKEIKKYNIKLITNPSHYAQDGNLVMERPPVDCPYYDEKVGISKKKIVEHLHEAKKYVVFAGDGPPDIEPARISEAVFAKKMLLDKCIAEGIETLKFDSFNDIYSFFEKELNK
ncbi:MAG: MtnX-like HAD-IB family phosphatase [Defluviitaleaceae bacterium]|nr:MtnX-like HAD-IB family phosphatase [Defluviitaleaceae bacterium]